MRNHRITARLALTGLAVVAATLFVALVPSGAANAARSGCVTKAEFRRVAIDNTQARVERVFGAPGTKVADLSITRGEVADDNGGVQVYTHDDMVVSYPKCSAWGTGRTVLVGMERWQPTESYRVWMKAPRSTAPVLDALATTPAPAAPAAGPSEWAAPTPDPVLAPPADVVG